MNKSYSEPRRIDKFIIPTIEFALTIGFEKDVFKVVKEYFLALEEPLIPYHLYPSFLEILEKAEQKDRIQLNMENQNLKVSFLSLYLMTFMNN